MYSYDRRRKTAAKMELWDRWKAIVTKHDQEERKEFAALIEELVKYFKSVGYDLDTSKSYLSKYNAGSDGVRMEGILTITEREENVAKATSAQQVKTWVEEATGMYGTPRKTGDKETPRGTISTWQIDITES